LPPTFWKAAALASGARIGEFLPVLPPHKRFVRLQRCSLTRQNGSTVDVAYPLILMPDLLHNVANMLRRISSGKNPLVLGNGTVSLASLEALYKHNAELRDLLRESDFAPVDRQSVAPALRLIDQRVIAIALANPTTHHLGLYLSTVADYFDAVHMPGLTWSTRIELLTACVNFAREWLVHCRADLDKRAVLSSKKETATKTRYCFSLSCIRAMCLALVNFVALAQWFGTARADAVRNILPAMTWLFCRCRASSHTYIFMYILCLYRFMYWTVSLQVVLLLTQIHTFALSRPSLSSFCQQVLIS